jgi:hypothetical protein
MTRSQKLGSLFLVCATVCLLLVLSFAGANSESKVSVEYVGNSNSGATAILRLKNYGRTAVRLNAYCTLYWTNDVGVATNQFFRHREGYAIIKPREALEVAIPHPSDAELWETSFTYQVRPNWIKRTVQRIRFWLPGSWVPDNSFIGRFSPLIRNPRHQKGTPHSL